MNFNSLFLLLSRAKQLIEQRRLEKEESENQVSPILLSKYSCSILFVVVKTHGVALHCVNYG